MYKGPERRKHSRANAKFVVSYRVYTEADNVEISRSKNACPGGMLLTTNRLFKPGTILAITVRLPFKDPIHIIARVLQSKEIVKNAIYDAHLSFLEVNEKHKDELTKTVDYYIDKDSK